MQGVHRVWLRKSWEGRDAKGVLEVVKRQPGGEGDALNDTTATSLIVVQIIYDQFPIRDI